MGKSTIKGITIEINGDSTKLQEELKKAGEGSQDLTNELKEDNKLLKFDPKNTELLEQKQKLLTQQIEKTGKQLDVLKGAEKQVQEQFARGEVSEEQYRALQREITKTEQNLEGLKKQADDTAEALENAGKKSEDIEKIGDRAEKTKDRLSSAGDAIKTGMAAAGTAIVAAGTYATNFETDYQKALNTAASTTGATAQEIEGLDNAMKAVYSNNFGESIQEVGEAMGIVAQQTGEIDPTKLQEMTESAFTLRDTFDMDIQESMRAVTQLTNQFGIDGSQAFDLIVAGAQNGLNKNDNLLDSINEYGPKFSQMGLSATDMFNMLQSGAEAGVFDIDKLGDAMNEFSIRAKDGTADTAFKDLGMDVEATKIAFGEGGEAAKKALQDTFNALQGVQDPIEQNRIGVELFGSMWEDTGGKAILAMGNMSGEAENAAGKMEELKQIRYDDLGSELEGLGRSIQTDLVKPVGEELAPVVSDVIGEVKERLPEAKEVLTDVISGVKEFINFFIDYSPIILPLIASIGAGLAAFNVVTMIQGLIAMYKKWAIETAGVDVAQKMLNSTMRANPLAFWATVITTVITALVLLYQNCEWFRDGVNAMLEAVVEFFQDAWEWIQETWEEVLPYFQEIWDGIKKIFSVVAKVLSTFSRLRGT